MRGGLEVPSSSLAMVAPAGTAVKDGCAAAKGGAPKSASLTAVPSGAEGPGRKEWVGAMAFWPKPACRAILNEAVDASVSRRAE